MKTFVLQTACLCAEGKWAMFCFVLKTDFAFIASENVAALHSPKVWLKRTGCRLSLLFCLPSKECREANTFLLAKKRLGKLLLYRLPVFAPKANTFLLGYLFF